MNCIHLLNFRLPRLRPFSFILVLVLVLCFPVLQGQKITLLEYSQKDSDTNCTYGLISGDTIVFKAKIDYTKDPTMKYVHIYIQKTSESMPFLYKDYNLLTDCNDTTDCRHLSRNEAEINVKVKASKEYSGAKIFGKIFNSDSVELNSETQKFPQIYDASDLSGTLLANGQEITTNSDNCVGTVNSSDMNIVFICESQVSPCWIVAFTNESMKSTQGKGHVTYNIRENKLKNFTVTIKYCACTLDRYVNTISCDIKTEERPERNSNYKDPLNVCPGSYNLLVHCIVLIILLFLSWVYIVVFMRSCFKMFLNKVLGMCKRQQASESSTDSREPFYTEGAPVML